MAGGFAVDLTTGDGYVVASLSGELDLAQSATLRDALDKVLAAGADLVIVDAADLSFVDSSGIGVLVGAHNHLRAAGGRLVIANLVEAVGRPVRITEVDTAIPVHWADPVVRPWEDPTLGAPAILSALGFADLAGDTADAAV